MTREKESGQAPASPVLEWLTGAVLLLVLAGLGWMIVAAYQPAWGRFLPLEAEVLVFLALLAAALVLVSVVALLHTRH
jgi:hypothetical protein